jgi:glutamate racemase
LRSLRERYAPLPVIGVLEPGAQAACAASATGRIAVIATEGTVRGGAYQAAIHAIRPDARVVAQPCALFVALAEEGWTEGPLVEGIVRRYLEPIFAADVASHPDCLLLGCTHFPVLEPVMRQVLDPAVAIVDSAETTARSVHHLLKEQALGAPAGEAATVQLLATDAPARFARVGGTFFGARIDERAVEPIDL